MHPVTTQIETLLKEKGLWYETFTHVPTLTSEESAKARPGYSMHQGAKALLLKMTLKSVQKDSPGEKFALVVLPADLKLDSKMIKNTLNLKEIRFASPDEVAQITDGILPGGIPPFGHLFKLETYVHPALLDNEKIVFNAGDRCFSIAMLAKEYIEIEEPIVIF